MTSLKYLLFEISNFFIWWLDVTFEAYSLGTQKSDEIHKQCKQNYL